MSESNTPLQKDIEDLVNKTIEANKIFINESTNLLKQITSNPGKSTTIPVFQNDFLSKAMNAYASLNVRHLKNMIDLGLSLTRQANTSKEQDIDNPTETQPAFLLKGTCNAGESLQLQFAIDNDKKEEVTCELVHTDYFMQNNSSVKESFKTVFTPQSFVLKAGGSQAIIIDLQTTKNSTPGLYISNVQVKGFEPAFFSIQITIN